MVPAFILQEKSEMFSLETYKVSIFPVFMINYVISLIGFEQQNELRPL